MSGMVRRRLLPIGAGLLATIAGPQVTIAAPEGADPSGVEALYIEGRDKYEAGDYVGAAQVWTRLLEGLPESHGSANIRENVLLNVIEAYASAFERLRDDQGHRDIEHLYAAKRVADAWIAQWTAAYGDDIAAPTAIQERLAELDRQIETAERYPDADIGPCLTQIGPCLSPCLQPPPPPPTRQGCGGNDAPQSAMLGLLPLAAIRRRRREVLDRLRDRLPPDVVARLHDRDDD
jgi:uncharacterized protein (TIGR03382 family)